MAGSKVWQYVCGLARMVALAAEAHAVIERALGRFCFGAGYHATVYAVLSW